MWLSFLFFNIYNDGSSLGDDLLYDFDDAVDLGDFITKILSKIIRAKKYLAEKISTISHNTFVIRVLTRFKAAR
jgi:hypothetical protein